MDGEDLARMGAGETQAYRRHVGFVFQDFKLIDRMTVAENTAFVLRVMGESETVQRRRAEQTLTWVGLQDRLDAYPSELSGGEQQRVAIARALVKRPMMILADEPTGNLDPDLALEIMNLFREINAGGTTVLVATHDRELIRQVGCRAIMLDHGVITEETLAVGDAAAFLPSSAATFGSELAGHAEPAEPADDAAADHGDQAPGHGVESSEPAVATFAPIGLEAFDASPRETAAALPEPPAEDPVPEDEPVSVGDAVAGDVHLSEALATSQTAEDGSSTGTDDDVFAALDAAFAGSEPAIPTEADRPGRRPGRRDDTG